MSKVILRTGAVDFNPLVPSADITLLSTSVGIAVRPSMEPALVSLLTHAIIKNPKSGFDKNGDPVLFYKPGEFPTPNDPELQVAEDARQVYKSGDINKIYAKWFTSPIPPRNINLNFQMTPAIKEAFANPNDRGVQ